MFYTEEQFNSQLDKLEKIYNTLENDFPKMNRAKVYQDYLVDEYAFVQRFCDKKYLLDNMFTGHVFDLDKYKKYNVNVQKVILHHIIYDNSKEFDPEKWDDYRYDNIHLNIRTLDDLINVFYEMALAQNSNRLYQTMCEQYSKEFIDEIKSEISIRSNEIKSPSNFEKNRLKLEELMEENKINKPVYDIKEREKILQDTIQSLNNEIMQANINYLKTYNKMLLNKESENKINALKLSHQKNLDNFKVSVKKCKDELNTINNDSINNAKYFNLLIDTLNFDNLISDEI